MKGTHKHINMTTPAMQSRTKPPGRWTPIPLDRLCAAVRLIEISMLRLGAGCSGLVAQNVRISCTKSTRVVSVGIRIAGVLQF